MDKGIIVNKNEGETMDWDSELYLKFEYERKQPCIDLLSHLNGAFEKILDLGCGPGNSTGKLFEKYGYSTIIGFDSDDNMLQKARKDCPSIEFIKGFAPSDFDKLSGGFDLIFSNACIHWIEDQNKLIDEIYKLLNPHGVFAVQIPLTDESKFYSILHKLIEQKWTKLKRIKNFHNMNQEGYYNALIKKFENITLWQSDYYHIVDKNMILEWYKGSGLRPYLALLDEDEQKEFLNDLQKKIDENYHLMDDGKVFLVMPRLFFIAEK